jgi:carboxymethylenebutenolidase
MLHFFEVARRHRMWNQLRTDEYEGMLAETITISGHNGDLIHAYLSRPLGEGPFPGIVLIPHMPGWDEFSRETARRFSQHGYAVVCPDIYCRFGHGTPEEISAKARAEGGVPDDSVMGDCDGSLRHLTSSPYSNGKVGVMGMCSGGRHAFLAACQVEGLDAAVDCWGGRVIAAKEDLTPAQPVAPIEYTQQLGCPLLGIFGNDDHYPTPEQVNLQEEELKGHGKDYEFYRYDGAGHGFFYYHTEMYRPKQAMDAWNKIFDFLGRHLGT